MKVAIAYISAAVCILALFGATTAYAQDVITPTTPEAGTAGVLAAVAVGALIARRLIKRK